MRWMRLYLNERPSRTGRARMDRGVPEATRPDDNDEAFDALRAVASGGIGHDARDAPRTGTRISRSPDNFVARSCDD